MAILSADFAKEQFCMSIFKIAVFKKISLKSFQMYKKNLYNQLVFALSPFFLKLSPTFCFYGII